MAPLAFGRWGWSPPGRRIERPNRRRPAHQGPRLMAPTGRCQHGGSLSEIPHAAPARVRAMRRGCARLVRGVSNALRDRVCRRRHRRDAAAWHQRNRPQTGRPGFSLRHDGDQHRGIAGHGADRRILRLPRRRRDLRADEPALAAVPDHRHSRRVHDLLGLLAGFCDALAARGRWAAPRSISRPRSWDRWWRSSRRWRWRRAFGGSPRSKLHGIGSSPNVARETTGTAPRGKPCRTSASCCRP